MDRVNSSRCTEACLLTTLPERLRELYHSDTKVHSKLGNNPNTPADILQALANSDDESIRFFVARNPSTPADTLKILAHDNATFAWRYVRGNVGLNPNTPDSILKLLAQDVESGVRCSVAENPNVPIALLRILAQDESLNVRVGVAYNRNAPVELLKLLSSDECEEVRRYVANNPSAGADILESLSHDKSHAVRIAVAGNFNTSASTLERLFSNCQAIGNAFGYRDNMVANLARADFQVRAGSFDREVWFIEYENFILAIAKNPNTPLHILNILSCYLTGPMLATALQNCVAENPSWN